ncbi:hypothetical protein ACEPAH_1923 [Sanghuangporus vaninii]
MRRGLECTVPPCSCGVPNQEHDTGSFTCVHLSGRSSEATSIGPAEENKIESSVSSLLSFNFPGYDELDALQGHAATTDTQSRLQGPSDPSNIHPSGNSITDPTYTQISPSEYPAFPTSFEAHPQLSNDGSQQGTLLQMPHRAGKDIVQNGSIGMQVDIADDRYKQEPLSIDGLQSGSTEIETPIYQECSSVLMNLPSHYQQFSTTEDLSGVGFGVGSSAIGALAATDGLLQLLGPVPMPMPLSMPVAVPATQPGPSQQNTASYNTNTGGLADHPLLRLSADYLTSELRPAQPFLRSRN